MSEPYFGCFTGDCPHETQAECDAAIRAIVATMEGELAALTAENERLTGLIRRAVDRYADHAVCKLSDGYGDPCTCGYEQWQIDAAAALPSSRETTDGAN